MGKKGGKTEIKGESLKWRNGRGGEDNKRLEQGI
jgi:hypothetical protein